MRSQPDGQLAPAVDEPRDRGIATAAVIVFFGLFLLMAVVGGVFFVLTSGSGGGGDPSKLELSTSRCGVSTHDDSTGVGSVTISLTYRGTGTIDLSGSTLRYTDDETERELRVGANGSVDADGSVGANGSVDAIRVLNDSGAYDPVVGDGGTHSITIPIDQVRDTPLPPASRASVELLVDSVSTGGTSFRTPGAIGPDSSYVDC